MKFEKFGWNDFFFEIPEEMRFASHGGDAEKGHFLLEAEDYLAEATWEPFKPKETKPLPEVLESIIEKMRKKSKKQEIRVLGKEDAHVSTHEALYCTVKSQAIDRLYIWHCHETKRLVILRLVFETFSEDSKKTMKRLLDTFKCHREETNLWSALNLCFEAPKTFLLTDTRLTVGRAQIALTESKLSAFTEKERKILVEYFSMANLIYKDSYRDLGKWFEENYLKDLRKRFKQRKIDFETVESRGFGRHDMVVKTGTTRAGISYRRTTVLTNATWYCPGTNRIYSITLSSSIRRPTFFRRMVDEEDQRQTFDRLLTSFECH